MTDLEKFKRAVRLHAMDCNLRDQIPTIVDNDRATSCLTDWCVAGLPEHTTIVNCFFYTEDKDYNEICTLYSRLCHEYGLEQDYTAHIAYLFYMMLK